MSALAPIAALAPADLWAQTHFAQRRAWQDELRTLHADLLANDSATAVLQAICDRRNAAGARIRARKVAVADDLRLAAAARRQLGAPAGEPIHHRRVELVCGEAVFSRADNWYLPGRLTRRMNTTLATTERPFGVVAAPLGFHRRTLSTQLLFEPLSPDWQARPADGFDAPVAAPAAVLQHRAVLATPDGRPFSLVVETYTDQVLTPR
jgi:hypothetical protein